MKPTTLLLAASTAVAGSLRPRQEGDYFDVVNFSAKAYVKNSMMYQGDFSFLPYSGHCTMETTDYTQCPDASGIKDFPIQQCGDSGFSWQLNEAGGGSGSGIDGWNLEITALGPDGDQPLYGCKYFPRSAVVCNNNSTALAGETPSAYLDVPSSFTMAYQTTSGCSYDFFTSTRSVAPPTGTPQATPTPA